jgi:hypothetical protein
LTLSASAEGDATRILVSGMATTAMAEWIDGLGRNDTRLQAPPPHSLEPEGPRPSLASRLGEWWERVA